MSSFGFGFFQLEKSVEGDECWFVKVVLDYKEDENCFERLIVEQLVGVASLDSQVWDK